jgi:serine protease
VAAAGNAGNDRKRAIPASYSSVVSVAATDFRTTSWPTFRSRNDQVELAAPGVDVLSTVPWLATTTLTVDGVTYHGQPHRILSARECQRRPRERRSLHEH